MTRTRFAPSPTGFMHIGNLRTALYEYLLAKSQNGKFILRIEDTDKERFVYGAIEAIYSSLKKAGIVYDEGPDIGGKYGPYLQSERKYYMEYAIELVKNKKAYYCFCSKKELEQEHSNTFFKYNRRCYNLTENQIQNNLKNKIPFIIRQLIPDGKTTFNDEVYGSITVNNSELEDQILIKSDGMPTYNFANVIDDHLMEITHIIRGSEYLSSTPKYNLLYEALNWEIPIYIHLPLILNTNGEKLSKRNGDPTFEDLLRQGYLPEAIVNYIALLGWSPSDNEEFFTLSELIQNFDIKGLSKSPATFDKIKLNWMNEEYIKRMDEDKFYELSYPYLKKAIKRNDINLKAISKMVQSRIQLIKDTEELVDFIDTLPKYDTELYIHKKMKTTKELSLQNLELMLPMLEDLEHWTSEIIHDCLFKLVKELNIKNGQILWPLRTALSGKPVSPCGAIELAELLGKEDCIKRIKQGIEFLKNETL